MQKKPLVYLFISGNSQGTAHKSNQIYGALSCMPNQNFEIKDFRELGSEALKRALSERLPDILVMNAGHDKGNINLVTNFPDLKNMILISSFQKEELNAEVGKEKIDRFALLCGSDQRNYSKLVAIVKGFLAKIVTDKLGIEQNPEGRNPAEEY